MELAQTPPHGLSHPNEALLYKVEMSLTNDIIAGVALVLVAPAVLFVLALFLRQWPPFDSEPARTAERVARWYASHPQFALWVLLLLLPLVAFVLGSSALLRTWDENPQLRDYAWRALAAIPEHLPAVLIGAATVVSASVLAMMARHLLRA
jgi:hypothetical protein